MIHFQYHFVGRKYIILMTVFISVHHLMLRINLGDIFSQYLQDEARLRIVRTLEDFDLGPTEKCVRINSVSSGLAEADLETILQARVLPSSMMLPKVEGPEEIQWVSNSAWLCS